MRNLILRHPMIVCVGLFIATMVFIHRVAAPTIVHETGIIGTAVAIGALLLVARWIDRH